MLANPREQRRRRGGDADPAGRRARGDDGATDDADHGPAGRDSRGRGAPTCRRPDGSRGGDHDDGRRPADDAGPRRPARRLVALQQGHLEQGPDDAGGPVEPPPQPEHGARRPPRDLRPRVRARPRPDRIRRTASTATRRCDDGGDPRRLPRRPLVPGRSSDLAAHNWRLLYFSKKGCPPSEQPLRNDARQPRVHPVAGRGAGQDHRRPPNLDDPHRLPLRDRERRQWVTSSGETG